MIALIDYGAGNLTSVKKALDALGAAFVVPDTPAQCAGASGLIVPGVGHFAATTALTEPWRAAIRAAVLLLGEEFADEPLALLGDLSHHPG